MSQTDGDKKIDRRSISNSVHSPRHASGAELNMGITVKSQDSLFYWVGKRPEGRSYNDHCLPPFADRRLLGALPDTSRTPVWSSGGEWTLTDLQDWLTDWPRRSPNDKYEYIRISDAYRPLGSLRVTDVAWRRWSHTQYRSIQGLPLYEVHSSLSVFSPQPPFVNLGIRYIIKYGVQEAQEWNCSIIAECHSITAAGPHSELYSSIHT